MAAAGKDGSNILLKLATTTVNGTTSQSIDFSVDMIETTDKDSSGTKDYLGGEFGSTFTVEGKTDEADTYTVEELYTALAAKALVAFIYGGQTAGNLTYSGNCLLSNLSMTDPQNDNRTFSVNCQVSGAVTQGTVGA